MNGIYLELTSMTDDAGQGVLLRDCILGLRRGPLEPGRVLEAPITRVTMTLDAESIGRADVHVLASNGMEASVGIHLYDLRIGGYALALPGTPPAAQTARILRVLAGEEPGPPPPMLSPVEARKLALTLAQYATRNGA